MQGTMNQIVPPLQQGHFMGMNPMHSGSLPTSGAPPPGGFPNGLPNMQAPSNASGPQMYPQGGTYNRPQAGQMSMMPGYNPYQVW
jgi:polyadenylation factor subunit 2